VIPFSHLAGPTVVAGLATAAALAATAHLLPAGALVGGAGVRCRTGSQVVSCLLAARADADATCTALASSCAFRVEGWTGSGIVS